MNLLRFRTSRCADERRCLLDEERCVAAPGAEARVRSRRTMFRWWSHAAKRLRKKRHGATRDRSDERPTRKALTEDKAPIRCVVDPREIYLA